MRLPLVRTAALKVGVAVEDVAAYAGVSGDRNPVHLDDAFARGTGGFDRGRIVHGMLAASLFPALIASPPSLPLRHSAQHQVRSDCNAAWGRVHEPVPKFAAPLVRRRRGGAGAPYQAYQSKAHRQVHDKCFTSDEETLAIDGEAMAFLPTLQLQLSSEPIS